MLSRIDAADRRVSRAMLVKPTTPRGRAGVAALRRLSQTGSYGIGWIVLFAVVVTLRSGWRAALIAAVCIVGTLLVNSGIKHLVRRPRPSDRAIAHAPSSFSMPSAHTSMAMVGGVVMTWCLPDLWPLWWAVVVALGWSRIALGMHFLGDVLAGIVLGGIVAIGIVLPLLTAWS